MAWPIIGPILEFGSVIAKGVIDNQKKKMELKGANLNSRIRMAEDEQSHNQDWEIKKLENAGWQDDILFYALLGMFVWAGINPTGAGVFFENLKKMPDWFQELSIVTFYGVIGLRKGQEYLPGIISGVRAAFKS